MRRIIIVSILFIFLSTACGAVSEDSLSVHWGFDDEGESALDSVSGMRDEMSGNFEYVDGVKGKALKFDGLTTFISRGSERAPRFSAPEVPEESEEETLKPGMMTVMAWVAPQVYPWSWNAIVCHGRKGKDGYFFGINPEGQVGFGLNMVIGEQWYECVSEQKIPLMEWTHIAGTFSSETGLKVYINGQEAGFAEVGRGTWYMKEHLSTYEDIDLLVGRSFDLMSSAWGGGRGPNNEIEWPMIFDGLLDEVKMYERVLSADEIKRVYEEIRPSFKRPLKWRVMPSGPTELNRFGAYYMRLGYADEWENVWRVGEHPDILVAFDELPIRVAFWRGTTYGPAWISENNKWMGDQSLETGSEWGCNEHMSDKRCHYSHVRLIESHDARAVVHWRYALCDIRYDIVDADDRLGWGTWTDEYYTIYPDGVAVRHQVLWTHARGPYNHQWQETIFYNQPGDWPEDTVELKCLTLANMEGQTHTYSWQERPQSELDKPENANIQMVNFKSRYKPFIIGDKGCHIWDFGGKNRRSHFQMWNHWPVGQVPNDGRNSTAPDRPSHSSISTYQFAVEKTSEISYEAATLYGMTDKKITQLLPLARSWMQAPQVNVHSRGVKSKGYDKTERAFVFTCEDDVEEIELTLAASEESPVLNPAFVFENWGTKDVILTVEGKKISRGSGFRYGFRKRLEGIDLVVWLKYQTAEPVEIMLSIE